METTAAKIRAFIISNFLFDEAERMPADTDSLLRDGIIDSTGVLDLLMFVEESFGFTVADEEVVPANFDSVASLTEYVRSKTSAEVRL